MADNDFFNTPIELQASAPTLAEIGEPVMHRKNNFIYRQADAADAVHFLQSGVVKLDIVSRHGRHAIIGILGAGAFFGEGCLAGQLVRNTSAVTMTDSRAYRISKSAMLRFMHSDAVLCRQFLIHAVVRCGRAEEDLIDRVFNSTEKRLARALLLLATIGGPREPPPLLESITQQTLAEIVGTTRPRISHFIGKFRRLGFVASSYPLRVHSSLVKVVLED